MSIEDKSCDTSARLAAIKDIPTQRLIELAVAEAAGLISISPSAAERAHQDAQPNEPLTLDELRGMVGQPVWVEVKRGVCPSGWSLVLRVTEGGVVFLARNGTLYGLLKENWAEGVQLYRRPPKEEHHEETP